jgi:diguanylate cyclase (GGDEF)-like protein
MKFPGTVKPPAGVEPPEVTTLRFEVWLTHGIIAALVVHAIFIVLFTLIDVRSLAIFNVASVAMYGVCLVLVQRGYLGGTLVFATTEVILHAWLAVAMIGWDSGFHYYVLVLATTVFFHPRWRLLAKILYVMFVCAAYLGINQWAQYDAPQEVTTVSVVSALNYFNIAACFVLLGFFSHHYSKAANEAFRKLKRLAGTDPLTGLNNRRRMLEIADQEIARHRRMGRSLAFIICDVDEFKMFNDRYGHECGDDVLQAVALQISATLRTQDHVARWGGEELLLLLPETTLEAAETVAEKLRIAVSEMRTPWGAEHVGVTLTAGVAELQMNEDFSGCLARADHALLEGKRSGKNRVIAVGQRHLPLTEHGVAS